jgi:hypothetical protein
MYFSKLQTILMEDKQKEEERQRVADVISTHRSEY